MNQTTILYSGQTTAITQSIQQGHTHYAKMDLIKQKYGAAVAPIFTQAYHWFIGKAETIVSRPLEAESALWAYCDLHNLEQHPNSNILELAIPIDQAIFFSMADWNKVLNQRYIGLSAEENAAFAKKLEQQGINYEGEVFSKPFYPQLRKEVIQSWSNLFRFHPLIQGALRQNTPPPIHDIQVGLWQIPTTWIRTIIAPQ